MGLIIGIILGAAIVSLLAVMAFRSFVNIFGNPTGESPPEPKTDVQDVEKID